MQLLLVAHLAYVVCRTHDWRRGHAKDMQMNGKRLWEILQAGDWRSPAFMEYLDLHRLEEDGVAEAHGVAELSDDDEDLG